MIPLYQTKYSNLPAHLAINVYRQAADM